MTRTCHYFVFVLFVCSSLVTIAQSGGKTVAELFSVIEISKKVRLLGDECWRLREIDSDSALVLGQEALSLAIKHNLNKELPRLNNFIGVIYLHYLYDTKRSILYFHRALENSILQKDSIQLGYSYNNLGDVYLWTGNIPLSLKYSENSLQIFRNLQLSTGISYGLVNMGLVHRQKKDLYRALDYFNMAKSIWEANGNELGIGSVLLELARTYEELGNIDKAMDFYQESHHKSHISSNVRYAAFCLHGMANIFYLRKEYDKAFEYYQNALELNQKRKHDFGLVDNYIGLALVYAHKNKRLQGEEALQKALRTAKNLGLNTKILKSYNSFAEFYQILDDYQKATQSYNQFLVQYDSILSIQQFEIINEMQNGFAIRQTLFETEQELESRKVQESYLMIIILLMLVIATVLYWRYESNRRINRQLAEMNQTKDKLFSVISHDLKNPFNSLIGFSDLLLEEVENNNYENVKKFAGYLHQASTEGMKLLTNLLDWSQSQTGRITFTPKPIKMDWLFGELNDFFGPEREKYGISINFNSLFEEEIIADPNILRTILMNLISNAIKYTREGGTIKLEASRTDSHVRIKVEDNGTGMSPEILDSLFDNSKITKSALGLRKEQGTGLGISVCVELIRIHNGTIRAESELGKGSVFEIVFPNNKEQ